MEEKVINEVEDLKALQPPTPAVVAIAISESKKGKYFVRWALDKFVLEGEVFFKLIHVRPKITAVPAPMGNLIPISQGRDDVAAAFRKEMEWQASEKLLLYKQMCAQEKVQVEIVQVESDDVVKAIAEEVVMNNINKLVIGASSRRLFSRGQNLSSKISQCSPSFCTVYAVSKGKLSSVRQSDSETNRSVKDYCDISRTVNVFSSPNSSFRADTDSYLKIEMDKKRGDFCNGLCHPNQTDQSSTASSSHLSSISSLPVQRLQALSTINQALFHRGMNTNDIINLRHLSINIEEKDYDALSCLSSSDINDEMTAASSFRSSARDDISTIDQASTVDTLTDFSSGDQTNINFELEKIRIELRHLRGMYAVAQNEAVDASRKLNDLNKRRLEGTIKLKEISLQEEEAKELAKHEKESYETAKREADYMKECAQREAVQKRGAEVKALREAREREKLENALVRVHQYQKFTWEEIMSATSSLSEDLRVGMGAYGAVYKCSLHHTTAAVKILHSNDACRTKQFQQELEILSSIRHPHLLILLGACPDHGCLVYEFMKNGSLEERLLRKNNSPPLPWFERCRIAWEVASALVYLHNSKPKAIIHRDLKPANILLDHNFVSKIGDVGLSTMAHSDPSSVSMSYKDTSLVGTFCYIDPEYQRTGLITPNSDVYAFGIVILQLITAKPPIALAYIVEKAIENNSLKDILDQDAGEWPVRETKELAMLALRCTELRGKDRPDLKDEVLPALEKLKETADRNRDLGPTAQILPPNMFVCPILKDLMDDPYVAADGYTYDRKAIEEWLEENNTSPVTNLILPHKSLFPNYTLLSAIVEWKSAKH
ncbi:hypothetical protein ACH5RR_016963 [Cinchona calisaya]|uniref:RING-type E3 ubiquitin transferase n=1 Tax=Cinchona calisaya TaxID=153742 RepID=A0ABD2ZXH0_9GENT